MKILPGIIARIIIYSQLLLIAPFVAPDISNLLLKYTIPQTYILTIDTPTYSNNATQEILEEFNKLGNYNAVKFGIRGQLGRPVTIKEMDENSLLYRYVWPTAIGLTNVFLDKCIIYLKKGQNSITYRETVIHEYLHCMGYQHVTARNDVMYKADNKENKDASIIKYAKELDKLYGQ